MTERIFLGWDRPLLRTASEYLADRFIRNGVLDLRDHVIVVAGGRAGRRIRERLLDVAEDRGARFVPPQIVGVGALPELFYEPEHPVAPPLVVRRLWARVLHSAAHESVVTIFGEAPARGDIAGWDALGGLAARLQREVGAGGHRFRDVAGVCEKGADLLFDDAERWHLLGALQERYASQLAGLGVSDQDLSRIDSLRGTALGSAAAQDGHVWLLGIAELPTIAASLLERSGTRVSALVQAPESEKEALDRFGSVIPKAWSGRTLSVADEHIRIVDRPADQAAAAVQEIARLGAVQLADVVVGTTDESLVPYAEEWLEASGAPVHYGGGIPIERTAPYRLLAAIADYLESRRWDAFAALVRHPDLDRPLSHGAPGAHGNLLGRVDRHFTRHLPAVLPRVRGVPAEEKSAIPPGSGTVDGRLLGSLDGRRPLQEWPELVLDLLVQVYGGRALNPHDPEGRRTIEVLKKIRSAALALHDLPEALGEECSASAAIRLLLRELASLAIPDEAESAAIDLLGWLEVAADDSPNVFVLGVNEPMLPQSINADPFLPDRLRSALGILDNARRYARDAFHVEALIHSRSTVRFFCGRLSPEGDPLRPSRLMLAVTGRELADRVLAFTRDDPKPTPPSPIVTAAGDRSSFPLPPRAFLEVEPPLELNVTAFAALLKDPYRYVLERQLGLRSLDDAARELDGSAFGTLAHQVLTRFGRSDLALSSDPREIRSALGRMLDEEAAATFAISSFPAVELQIEQLRLRLGGFAEWQAERVASGWEIVFVEGRLNGRDDDDDSIELPTLAPFDVDGETVMIKGRIDRIDHHPETGRWAILDYKTGDTPKTPNETHMARKEWKDLQLPLYRHLAATIDVDGQPLISPGAEVELGYVLLCREVERACGAMAEWSEEDLAAADEKAREVIRSLRQGRVEFAGSRDNGYADDPMAPLLGARQLVAFADDDEEEEKEFSS